jgi:hypothetical protein
LPADATGSEPEDLPPRRRPAAVELAAALLIVTGIVQLVGAFGVAGTLPAGLEGLLLLTIALDIATIVAGILIRMGRFWLLVVNYVAVIGFLDLLRVGASPLALAMAIVDAVVLYVLFTNRSWFGHRPPDEADDAGEPML